MRRLPFVILLLLLASPGAADAARTRGVLSCGPAGPALANGPVSMVPPRARRVRTPQCVTSSAPVGVARDGLAILPATTGVEGAADGCGRRTLPGTTLRFYRESLRCLDRGRAHRRRLGTARDGFAIYGARGARRLDRCHGHTRRIGGRRAYHYHWTRRAPFTVGCFRGVPARWSWGRGPLEAPPLDAQPTPTPAPTPGPPADTTPVDEGPAGGWPDVDADPALDPPFDPSISDYVVACDPSTPVDVAIDAPAGTVVSVDGAAGRTGAFSRPVALGESQGTTIAVSSRAATGTFHVRCLPSFIPAMAIERNAPGDAPFTVIAPLSTVDSTVGAIIVADRHATPVWWKQVTGIDAKAVPGGRLAWMVWQRRNYGSSEYVDYDLDGTAAATWTTGNGVGADSHDMQALPGGDRLMVAYRERSGVDLSAYGYPSDATVLDGEVQRVGADGTVRWSWSTNGHITLAEAARWKPAWPTKNFADQDVYDIVHLNAVEPDGDDFLISLRHTDAVYRIDGATGAVEWKLGGTDTPERIDDVAGDAPHTAEQTFGGQHDVRLLPDGTITVHDNRTGWNEPPRAVRFAVDPAGVGEATLLESVTDAAHAPGSFCCGGARRLKGGNWVVQWGGVPTYGEYEPDGTPRWRVTFPTNVFSYRATPVAEGQLTAVALRAGMDAMYPRP